MVIIKMRSNFLWLIALMVWGLTSCASPDERIKAKFDTLPQVDSTLLYDYSGVSSSAAGNCNGSFRVHWYGTAMSTEDVVKLYLDYLTENGWSVWPEEVVEIWSQDNDDGLYRMGVSVFNDPGTISQEQGSYTLPASVLLDATHYQTIYLLTMSYNSPYAAKKCFGHYDAYSSNCYTNIGLSRSIKAAEHSVHPTGGSLRVFRQFAWLGVGSVKVAFSRPTHQRVTQAVGRLNLR